MEVYTIISHAGDGFYLTASVSDSLDSRLKINITGASDDICQKWMISSLLDAQIRSASNAMYMLNAGSSICDCGLCTEKEENFINFEKVDNDIYRLRLKSNTDLYLTADSKEDGANVRWAKIIEESDCQKWKIVFTVKSYIMANSWLKLYTSKTSSGGRSVQMPTVNKFTAGGYTYQFTNKKYWYSHENPYGDNINPYAVTQIKNITGRNPTVLKGSHGELTDGQGNYWMAVGPNVVNPNHSPNANITPAEMYGLGKLDVVVKDDNGDKYYIPGVVGDAKAHTWSNGIIQTWKSYPSGALTSAGENYNGVVCAEFIGSVSVSGLNNYSIVKIIFYEN